MGFYKLKLAIMQPTFNPWLGYFDLIEYVDKFIFLDIVQLNQQSWQTRNKIKVQNKELLYVIPTQKNSSKKDLLIKDTFLDFRKFDFRKKLLKTLQQSYKKAKYFSEVDSFIKDIVLYDTDFLSNYNINIIKQIVKKLNIDTQIVVLSKTDFKQHGLKGDLILEICNYFDTTKYISPLGSKEYLDKVSSKFKANSMDIYYQYYNHPNYTQLGDEFIPYLGIFDLLYNEGFENSAKIIKSGRKYENR